MKPLQPARPDSFLNHSVYIFLIRFFPTLAALLVMIGFSRQLPEGIYGSYQYFWVQFYVCSAVACLGIHSLILTYAPQVLERLLRTLTPRTFLAIALWIGLAAAGFAIMQHREGMNFSIAFLFLITGSLAVIAESFLIVYRQFRVLTAGNLLYALVFCLLHWTALEYGLSMNELFLAITATGLLRLSAYIPVIFRCRRKTIPRPADPAAAGRDEVRTLWIHMGLYDLVQILFRWVDKLVISLVVSRELFAVYYNGSLEIPFLPLILSAAGSAGLLQLAGAGSSALPEDRSRQSVSFLRQSGRILSCVVFPLFFFLLFFRYELFEVAFGNKYLASVPLFLVSLFAVPVRAYSFTTVLQHYHKGQIINTGAILDLVIACALMYPLYQWLGLPGAVLSFVITTWLQAAFYLYHTARILRLPVHILLPLRNWAAKLAVSCLLFLVAHTLLTSRMPAVYALLTGGLILAVSVILILAVEIRNNGRRSF